MSVPKDKDAGANIAYSIQRYGFAATIEVSNHLKERSKKSQQANLAKSYLEEIVLDESEILAGVAFNGGMKEPPYEDGIDFIIEINRYIPSILNNVAEDMLGSRYLSGDDKRFLEKMLSSRCKDVSTVDFFLKESFEDCAKSMGLDPTYYQNHVGNISGLGVEMYVKSCLERLLPDAEIHHRFRFTYKRHGHVENIESDSDNLVICRKPDFYNALYSMNRTEDFTTWFYDPLEKSFCLFLGHNSLV